MAFSYRVNFKSEKFEPALAFSNSFGKWNAEKYKFFENRTTSRYAYRPSKFCYYHTYVEWGYKQNSIFFKFLKIKIFFSFCIWILHEKCVLLRYIMLMLLKLLKSWRGAIIVIVAYGGSSQSFNFWETSTLIMYLKRTHFSCRIQIQKRKTIFVFKNF